MLPFPPDANIINGDRHPDSSIGNEGDYYVDIPRNLGYGPKVGIRWGKGYDLRNFEGDEGGSGGITSVNGDIGPVVVLTTDDISEGSTNFYYTSSRFNTSFSSKTTDNLAEGATNLYDKTVVLSNGIGISLTGTYPNFTVTNSAPDQTVALTNGTGISITGTYPNFTITNTSPSTVTPSALTKTDDTNITLTLGGTPTTALLQSVSLTLGWTGTLADARIASATAWNAKQNALSGTGIVKSTAGTISYISGTSGQFVKGDGSLDSTSYGTGSVTTVSVVSANGLAGSVATATTTPAITLSTTIIGILKGNGTAISAASSGTDYEVPLTFSTGLTRTTNTITVNTSQNIAKLSNLTSNGFIKTGSGDGTLSVDTSTYITGNQTITLSGDATGSGATSIAVTLATVSSTTGTFGSATQVAQVTNNAKGLVTATANVTIQIAESQVTNLVSDLAAKQPTISAGTGVSISSNVVRANDVVYKVPSTVNLKATGNTTVFTTESSKGRFIIREVRVHMVTLTGAGSAASVSLGVTSTAFTDISANAALTTLSQVNQYGPLTLASIQISIPASTAVVFKVNTAATYATANTADVYITGWYEQF